MTLHFSACKKVFNGYTVWGTVCFLLIPQDTLTNRIISVNNLYYLNAFFFRLSRVTKTSTNLSLKKKGSTKF